jgi:hypothetical protein
VRDAGRNQRDAKTKIGKLFYSEGDLGIRSASRPSILAVVSSILK